VVCFSFVRVYLSLFMDGLFVYVSLLVGGLFQCISLSVGGLFLNHELAFFNMVKWALCGTGVHSITLLRLTSLYFC